MMPPSIMPEAAYRLQLNKDFTFEQAAALVPYLRELGVSHVYASPFLKARPDSPHGYDIVDHNLLNPEIGDSDSFNKFIDGLQEHGMGLILDFIPNHMGVGGCDNAWWLDVLENGQASSYASYFDIDWQPVKNALQGKVLLPLLGDHYGSVLDKGELVLHFDAGQGAFTVRYYEHCFPVDPATYPRILLYDPRQGRTVNPGLEAAGALQQVIDLFCRLPPRSATDPVSSQSRYTDGRACKMRLAELCKQQPDIGMIIRDKVNAINAGSNDSDRFLFLHELLEAQAYRLAYWRVAADEINYRRFFNINGLAGIRVEKPEVFDAIHRLVFTMAANKQIQGLRIDHPDGLHDPLRYFRDLAARRSGVQQQEDDRKSGSRHDLYIVVEKILAPFEKLPENWPVHGTTGYDFLNQVNGLLVNAPAEKKMTAIYSRFLGRRLDYDELLYEAKKLIITTQLSSELTVLANLINNLSEADPHTRDFTLNGLRTALIEVVACFPVYRTYISEDMVSQTDHQYVAWAISQAKKRNPAGELSIFDFLGEIILGKKVIANNAARGSGRWFAMKLQQYTAPAMAKAMEDTVFYQFNRLVSLNEVGGDPKKFGISIAAFHHLNQQRRRHWPHAMLTTSTHDTKRSEDVRARINVLTEMAGAWREHVVRWGRINRRLKSNLDGGQAPTRNDEYQLYQNLIGAWPLDSLNDRNRAGFVERMARNFLKAIRESKTRTSWVNPNAIYEQATDRFLRNILDPTISHHFLADFVPFQKQIAYFGMLNSLSQVILKLTSPGVPDLFQGDEIWNYNLVDPDNRRPVDFGKRRQQLAVLWEEYRTAEKSGEKVQQLVRNPYDGKIKLYVIRQCLMFRKRSPKLFSDGSYLPLESVGSRADHVCCFARVLDDAVVIIAVPRWNARLTAGEQKMPLGRDVWQDTGLVTTPLRKNGPFTDIFTGERLQGSVRDGRPVLKAAEVFARFPVALLVQQ